MNFFSNSTKKEVTHPRINKPLFHEDTFPSNSELDFASLSEQELYENILHPQARDVLINKYEHNPNLWLDHFHKTNDFRRDLRILVGRQTVNAMDKEYYNFMSKTKVNINKKEQKNMAESTIFYTESNIPVIKAQKTKEMPTNSNEKTPKNLQKSDVQSEEKTNDNNVDNDNANDNENDANAESEEKQISKKIFTFDYRKKQTFAINADCIDVACLLQNRGYNPVVLNMANAQHAGGGWERGSGAQEENLFRRSTYCASLHNTIGSFSNLLEKKRKWAYPIGDFGCIYSPNICVLRSNESSGYKWIKQPYSMSFIASAMYRFPKMDKDRRYKDDELILNIKKKIRSILRVSYLNNHDCLVMSAFGCGAFANPPEHQAELWGEVLKENEFENMFDCVVFAVLDDHNAWKNHNPNGNFQPFADVFGELKLLELY